eukprot:TRINITY_DN3874_c0_g1_i1.p1 TRINITY_DN3874_c0_g1~~TRINITY_DN3874_c0_g1_i1.p1  ORF type:complete len:586 (+),score=197.52 TRINITY_DN3874_c0_g1_i1:60-1817(+)
MKGPYDAVCFGEALLCFKTRQERVPSAECRRDIGGAELNTACALSNLGRSAAWLSVLPESTLAQPILDTAKLARVDTSHVVRDSAADAEVGTLHTHAGAVHYQRRNSSFCVRVEARDFDWTRVLKGAGVFNSTGITPSLSPAAHAAWLHAVRKAASLRVPVTFDLNWRPALTTLPEIWRTARQVIREKAVTLLVVAKGNLKQIAALEGLQFQGDDTDSVLALLSALRARLRVPLLACCFKSPIANRPGWQLRWSAVAADGGRPVTTQATPVHHKPVEPLGGGDAWLGGFIDGALDGQWFGLRESGAQLDRAALRKAARRGDLLAALHQETEGDVCMVRRAQLQAAEVGSDGATAVIGVAEALVGWKRLEAALQECPVVPVITMEDAAEAADLCRALTRGGMRVLEITFRTAAAEASVAEMSRAASAGVVVGAGTILSVEQAERAVRAGAKFLVSPGVDPDIVEAAKRLEVPIIPGVATATDVATALRAGVQDLKFFPAEPMGGLSMMKALGGPHPGVRWMPTGGVTPAKMQEYLKHSSVMACGGSWMVPSGLIRDQDWVKIERLAADAASAAAAVRPKPVWSARM